jgi:hypothetical protein
MGSDDYLKGARLESGPPVAWLFYPNDGRLVVVVVDVGMVTSIAWQNGLSVSLLVLLIIKPPAVRSC